MHNAEAVAAGVRRLAGFFGRKVTDDALGFYVQEFFMLPDNVFNAAVTECQRTEKSFPTPTVLKNYVIQVRTDMERKSRSRSSIQSWKDLARTNPDDPECIKESKRLLGRIALPHEHPMHLCGDLLVAEMRTMEVAFPGRGWAREASGLEQDLKKQAAARAEQAAKQHHTDDVVSEVKQAQREDRRLLLQEQYLQIQLDDMDSRERGGEEK